MKYFLLYSFSIFLLSCSNSTSVKVSKGDLTGAYIGKYPCNNCDFSRYVLVLNQDDSFILKALAKADKTPKEMSGQWQFLNNEVVLKSKQDLPANNFALSGNNFLTAKNIVLGKYGRANKKLTNLALNGADVAGFGNTNNWNFSITVGKHILLNHPAFDGTLELKYHKPVGDYELHTFTWQWTVNGTDIELVINEEGCGNEMPASAVLKVNGVIKEACVQYLHPNFLLQKAWQVQKFNGEALIEERFDRGLPVLEIDAFSYLGMGHTGCNVWNGGIKLNGNKIVIMPGAMSNKHCGWQDFENEFVKTIGQEFEINYLGDKLELLVKGVVIFEFIALD